MRPSKSLRYRAKKVISKKRESKNKSKSNSYKSLEDQNTTDEVDVETIRAVSSRATKEEVEDFIIELRSVNHPANLKSRNFIETCQVDHGKPTKSKKSIRSF